MSDVYFVVGNLRRMASLQSKIADKRNKGYYVFDSAVLTSDHIHSGVMVMSMERGVLPRENWRAREVVNVPEFVKRYGWLAEYGSKTKTKKG